MKLSKSSILYCALAASHTAAFMGHNGPFAARSTTALQNILDPGLDASIRREVRKQTSHSFAFHCRELLIGEDRFRANPLASEATLT